MHLACERLGEAGKINGHLPSPDWVTVVSRPGRLAPMGWLEGYHQGESLTHLTAHAGMAHPSDARIERLMGFIWGGWKPILHSLGW